jgi:hypothetical protein
MEVWGTIKSGKLMLQPEISRLRDSWLAGLKDGTSIHVTMTAEGKPKTCQQLAAFFGMVVSMAKEKFDELGIDCMGVPLSKDQIKELLYHYAGGVGDHGEVVRLSRQTTQQASKFFEQSRNWLAQFGVVVPDPTPFLRREKK